MDESRYKLIGNFENLDTGRKFEVYQVMRVISHDDDHERRLFRIEEVDSDKPFYKGICISRTNLKVEENLGKKTEDIWEQHIEDYIGRPLIYDDNVDRNNREIEIAYKMYWKNLDADGGYING